MKLTRRSFLRSTTLSLAAAPLLAGPRVFGANDRITMAGIGMGGQGRGDLGGFLGFEEVQVLAVCDVVANHRQQAKAMVDARYGNNDCASVGDHMEVLTRSDIDAVLIATPDHWHALIAAEAMRRGKDVYSEKPETLTVRQGRRLEQIVHRYGRVYSGGSQRVWGDYNWYHKMVRGGAIGEPKEAWVNVGGPSGPCYLAPEPVPEGVDWNRWLGPAPWRPFHPSLIAGGFRPYRDYSGGGMTDWGCHGFGGALFTLNLQDTGPVKIIPPDGKDVERLTFVFANGIRIYHGGGWGGLLSFRGTEGEIPDPVDGEGRTPPDIDIPNYKGRGGIFGDFLHCVRTREKPFRDIERAHRTATTCHLGNIAYWLKRPLQWDPEKEEILGDPEASRWLDRSMREPWTLA
ncbi:MAG: Gfo/Idh/MocA family oxidoreductase [Verrucomicrobiales bacterium]|nr:Gfo/Idh/MocA family oxidoreductase [Verrucomicrobiales bacterium]